MENSERPVRTEKRKLLAYTTPMLVFVALLSLTEILPHFGRSFWLASPQYWTFPAQTLICAALLLYFCPNYEFQPLRQLPFTLAIAVAVFLLWIAPQQFLGFAPRLDGFNPDVFGPRGFPYWSTVTLRFLRLVVVVPLVEEIFWRGFLLRFFISERFDVVPFGKFSWLSFFAVTLGFCFAHSAPDRVAAFITGALYNCVAYRSKSLTSCVLAHAVTNLLLGAWIMFTRQWGFW
jgi:CAAX prenyl protease-like protein